MIMTCIPLDQGNDQFCKTGCDLRYGGIQNKRAPPRFSEVIAVVIINNIKDPISTPW